MCKKGLMAASLALALSGCAMLPQKPLLSSASLTETQNSIIDGKTTADEVTKKYSNLIAKTPTEKGQWNITWQKTWADLGFQAANVTRLTALVNSDGIVVKHIVDRYPVTMSNGFLETATRDDVAAKIKQGVSTKATMLSAFGQPRGYMFDDEGHLVMTYVWDNISDDAITMVPIIGGLAGTQSGKINTLFITLNDDNTVASWRLESANAKRGVGVMNASAIKVSQ